MGTQYPRRRRPLPNALAIRCLFFKLPCAQKRPHGKLTNHHRNLEHKDRSGCHADGKQRLRDPGGKCFVGHVPSPLTELIEQGTGCAVRQCTTNGIPDRLLRKT